MKEKETKKMFWEMINQQVNNEVKKATYERLEKEMRLQEKQELRLANSRKKMAPNRSPLVSINNFKKAMDF